jgi:conjugal transfer mating pair stabilization protein TraN
VTNQPATTQTRSCLRYLGVGNYSCARSLTVATDRTTSCTPGDWFAHAGSGRAGIDVQCLPDRPETAQHFRVTQDSNPLTFFDVNMTTPVVFPEGGRCTVTTADRHLRRRARRTKVIDGRPVTRACWSYERTLTCTTCTAGAPVDECAPLPAAVAPRRPAPASR